MRKVGSTDLEMIKPLTGVQKKAWKNEMKLPKSILDSFVFWGVFCLFVWDIKFAYISELNNILKNIIRPLFNQRLQLKGTLPSLNAQMP